jgi:predicted O-methyltransferase YrrM
MEITHHKAEEYSKKITSSLDDLLEENERDTLKNHTHPQMHSGHVQGKLLEMVSKMINPLKVLEIGTFTGFSALCLVKGLQENGMLHTIEIREEDATNAQKYINRCGESNRITIHTGDANEIIKQLNEKWDLVFIDADKTGYINYYELTLPSVNRGGWIIADNVLFHGEVFNDEIKGKNARAIHSFNEYVKKDPRVEQVLLTVRDGLLLIRKL